MKHIELDASGWQEPDDFYNALLPQLGAPTWHGRNLDALEDSILVGEINAIEAPFHISISGTDTLSPAMREFLARVRAVFADNTENRNATISFAPTL